MTAMLYPSDLSTHLLLAQEYLKRGNLEEMERELFLAQNLVDQKPEPGTSVLAATLSPIEILMRIQNEPAEIKKEVLFWEKEISEKPGYRDAYLQLAILNYRLYEKTKAQGYLQQALNLDPNFAPTRKLQRLILNP